MPVIVEKLQGLGDLLTLNKLHARWREKGQILWQSCTVLRQKDRISERSDEDQDINKNLQLVDLTQDRKSGATNIVPAI